MADSFEVGDSIRVSASFTVASVATDPTAVSLVVKNPAGTETTYTYALSQVTKSATGVYYKDLSLTLAGIWFVRWVGTGTCSAAYEGYFFVKSEF